MDSSGICSYSLVTAVGSDDIAPHSSPCGARSWSLLLIVSIADSGTTRRANRTVQGFDGLAPDRTDQLAWNRLAPADPRQPRRWPEFSGPERSPLLERWSQR